MQKLPRRSSEDDRADLKAATRNALRQVSAKSFALMTRIDEPALSKYGSLSEPASFMPADVIVDLQHEFGVGMVPSPVLAELARICGFQLLPLDVDGDAGTGSVDLMADLAAMQREGSESVSATLAAAINSTCASTLTAARKEIREGVSAFVRADRSIGRRQRQLRSAS